MRDRFHAAESQLADSSQADGQAGCQLSLFEMSDRLNRMDAAKLFYQVLGECALGLGCIRVRLGGGRELRGSETPGCCQAVQSPG